MQYPLCITTGQVFSLLGPQKRDEPFIIAFTSDNSDIAALDLTNQRELQSYLEQTYGKNAWGISEYLEYREPLLRHLPQMREEKRYYHLGLDIIVPCGTPLFVPLDGIVHMADYEEGEGNYGGYVILRHEGDFETFYSLHGHLDTHHLPQTDEVMLAGREFARIGDFDQNGNWFHHTHLQILTQRAINEGRTFQGYVTAHELPLVPFLFPDPHALFRYITMSNP